jgi:hypothetical protein
VLVLGGTVAACGSDDGSSSGSKSGSGAHPSSSGSDAGADDVKVYTDVQETVTSG